MAVMATLANFCPQKFVCHLNRWWPMPSFQATQFEQKCVCSSAFHSLMLVVSILGQQLQVTVAATFLLQAR